MRVLRSSLFPPNENPVTVVIRDIDIICSIEAMREGNLHHAADCLVWFDEFEVPDGTSIEAATLLAVRRQQNMKIMEEHLKTLFYFSIAQLAILKPQGVLLMDKPMPLKAEEIRQVFTQLGRTEFYRGQRLIAFDSSMVRVEHDASTKESTPDHVS